MMIELEDEELLEAIREYLKKRGVKIHDKSNISADVRYYKTRKINKRGQEVRMKKVKVSEVELNSCLGIAYAIVSIGRPL